MPESSSWRIWLSAIRPRTLPAAVAPVLVGSALAWRDGGYEPAAAVLCLAFALLVQGGTNFANDYYDFVKGADTAARVGPRRAVASGLIPPAVMHRAMLGTFAAAFVAGLGLIPFGGPWLILIGIASIAAGYAYTGGPWPLGYHGLGDVFVFIFFGLVAVAATYLVQAGAPPAGVYLAGAGVGALAANILVVNNYRDADTDAAAGKRTLVVRFGRGFARAQFGISLGVAFLVPVALFLRGRTQQPDAFGIEGQAGPVWLLKQEHPLALLLPLLLLPVAWGHFRRLRREASASELIALLGATGRLLALYALLLSAGMIV